MSKILIKNRKCRVPIIWNKTSGNMPEKNIFKDAKYDACTNKV